MSNSPYNQSGTAYNYNQSEFISPALSGTRYFNPRNNKNLSIYTGLAIDIDFYLRNQNYKSLNIQGKKFVATVVERDTNNVRLSKTLYKDDRDSSKMVLQLTPDDSGGIDPGLYHLYITYTDSDNNRYPLYSDENQTLHHVLEVKENPLTVLRESAVLDDFATAGGDLYYSSRTNGTAPTFNRDGTNTCAVYLTNFTGKIYAYGALDLNPSERDWFEIELDPENTETFYSFDQASGVYAFTWDGMFMWIRFAYLPDDTNQGTVEKILYRN